MKNLTIVIVLCLLCLSLAHKDKKEQRRQTNSIYKPFTDVPQPSDQIVIERSDVESEKLPHENQEGDDNKQQQIQQFNEMLSYGLVIGTMFLACLLFRTCGNHKRHLRQQRIAVAPASQNMMTHVPMLNKNVGSANLKNQIEWHKMQIKRLEQEAKHMEEIEHRMLEERQNEKKRQDEVLKAYYNQVQMQEQIQPTNYYNQQYSPQYQYLGNLPVGRPIPRDNDSSFASEYPTI